MHKYSKKIFIAILSVLFFSVVSQSSLAKKKLRDVDCATQTPTKVVNNDFATNMTLFYGSPGMVSGGGALFQLEDALATPDDFIFASFFFGSMIVAGCQPSYVEYPQQQYYSSNAYDKKTNLIFTQTIANNTFGEFKVVGYNPAGLVQTVSQKCAQVNNENYYATMEFVYDSSNRISVFNLDQPAQCTIDNEAARYNWVYLYNGSAKSSLPSSVKLTGSSNITPYEKDFLYEFNNGVMSTMTISGTPTEDNAVYLFEYTDSVLTGVKEKFDRKAGITYQYDDGKYSGMISGGGKLTTNIYYTEKGEVRAVKSEEYPLPTDAIFTYE